MVKKVLKKQVKLILYKFPFFENRLIKRNWKGDSRVFCVSTQKTGTSSVGEFLKRHGFSTAGWETSNKNLWTKKWFDGDYESIFSSDDFKRAQAFEDDPWWCPEFYKVLFNRFPDAKFILFTRNSDSWFQSMINHADGKTIYNTQQHCKIYRREKDLLEFKQNHPEVILEDYKADNLLSLAGYADHYKELYEIRNREIINFFKQKGGHFLTVDLSATDKWEQLASFLDIDLVDPYDFHINRSIRNK